MSTENSESTFAETELEQQLKDLLERMLVQMERYIETKDDLNQVEKELKDYENLSCLVGIIKVIFSSLMNKVEYKLNKLEKQIDPLQSSQSVRTEDEYEKLEQIIQKHEAEIRTHIRLEQQLKLYAESVQSKLDESEQTRMDLLETTKSMINNIKRENQKMNETIKILKEENDKLTSRIKSIETESLKQSIENNNKMDYQINMLTKQSQQVKGMVNKKSNYENRQIASYSEHKIVNQFDNHQIMEEAPTQSQGSLKQNYMNHITLQHNVQESIKTNQSEMNRLYGQLIRQKNNSISSIQDITQSHNISIKDRKVGILSQNVSKNSSNNNSLLQRKNIIKETLLTQTRSRSGSQKRPQVYNKQKTESFYQK
ncbi:hypothetical protein pb186bvf_015172 [Paramecium bursaria]